jgi:hypothetical protein
MPPTRLLLAVVLTAAILTGWPGAAQGRTVWLCKPGKQDNPCAVKLTTDRYSPSGERLGVTRVRPARRPRFDCFYVYPTVSDQHTPTANRRIDPELRSIALYQAARYTSECRMYAPVYRQITLAALGGAVTVTPEQRERAYLDVREAWRTYLHRFNHDRGVVLVGHSQGTFMLRELVKREIDLRRRARRRLISALLLGGQILVPRGRDVGGDFRHVRACRSRRQVGCVVAFNTFNGPVPTQSRFGRTTEPGLEVLCTNPAALAGGRRKLTPIYPREPFAPETTIGLAVRLVGRPVPPGPSPWLSVPGSYRGGCVSEGGANTLQIAPRAGAPMLRPVPDANWGLHLADANIALGNLVKVVRRQAAAWQAARR